MNEIIQDRQSIHLFPAAELAPRSSRIPRRHVIEWQPSQTNTEGDQPAVQVFMTRSAFLECNHFAQTDLENEVGGWLLGKWRVDRAAQTEFILIDTVLPAAFTINNSSFLTFTQQSQVELHTHLDTHFPDKELVGWFHTHPRMGVFLSSYDTWLHEHFFPARHQVALVIEPHTAQGGFFIRQENDLLDPRQYFGFRELTGPTDRSVMDWRNLSCSS